MSKKSRARHAALLREIEKPTHLVITIKRVGWTRYSVGSADLPEPVTMSTHEVRELRRAIDRVRQVLPEIAVEDWHKRTRSGWPSWARASKG